MARTLDEAFRAWDAERAEHANWMPRLLVTADPAGFHLRRVEFVEHSSRTARGKAVYHCDKALGSAKSLDELPALIAAALADIRRERE